MIQIDRETCARCGLCAANCCVHAIYQREDGSYACRSSLCFHCAQCVAICPTGAVSEPDLPPPVEYDSARFDISPENLLNPCGSAAASAGSPGRRSAVRNWRSCWRRAAAPPPAPTARPSGSPFWTGSSRPCGPGSGRASPLFARNGARSCCCAGYQNYLRHPTSRTPFSTAPTRWSPSPPPTPWTELWPWPTWSCWPTPWAWGPCTAASPSGPSSGTRPCGRPSASPRPSSSSAACFWAART